MSTVSINVLKSPCAHFPKEKHIFITNTYYLVNKFKTNGFTTAKSSNIDNIYHIKLEIIYSAETFHAHKNNCQKLCIIPYKLCILHKQRSYYYNTKNLPPF